MIWRDRSVFVHSKFENYTPYLNEFKAEEHNQPLGPLCEPGPDYILQNQAKVLRDLIKIDQKNKNNDKLVNMIKDKYVSREQAETEVDANEELESSEEDPGKGVPRVNVMAHFEFSTRQFQGLRQLDPLICVEQG